jgi:hypothetical protein
VGIKNVELRIKNVFFKVPFRGFRGGGLGVEL